MDVVSSAAGVEFTSASLLRSYATWAEIDLSAVRQNVRALKAHVGDGVLLAAVVKANAYGHGAVPLAQAALDAGAARLAVARIDEGIQLRNTGIMAPILVLGYVPPVDMRRAVHYSLTLTVNSEQQVLSLARASVVRGVKTPVHLKLDTGMNRYGSSATRLIKLAGAIERTRTLELEGLYTHFACADEEDKSWTSWQFEAFMSARDRLAKSGFTFPLCHAASSAATIDLPETHLDMVRPGLALFGLYPSTDVSRDVHLQPALVLKGRVGRVHDIGPGDGVSYGYTFVAARRMKVALIPVGYADGLHRMLSNRASVLIRGQRAKVVGRVCMDQLVVDVSPIDHVRVGDEAVVIGQQGEQRIEAEEVAELSGTIVNEVCTRLSPRVPRLYFDDGQLCGYSDLNASYSPITRRGGGIRKGVAAGRILP